MRGGRGTKGTGFSTEAEDFLSLLPPAVGRSIAGLFVCLERAGGDGGS